MIAHERRAFDVAVLTLRTSYRPPYMPGQSIGVCTPAMRARRYQDAGQCAALCRKAMLPLEGAQRAAGPLP